MVLKVNEVSPTLGKVIRLAVTTATPVRGAQGTLAGFSGGRTNTVTASAALSLLPSFTTSENSKSVLKVGAVKVGIAGFVVSSVTVGPPVWVQA